MNLGDLIQETLEILEQTGGDVSYIIFLKLKKL